MGSFSNTIIYIIILLSSIGPAFSSSSSSSSSASASASTSRRPLAKLHRNVVILISLDGFRFGYQYKTPATNINRLIKGGTEAELGMIPVFPTLTFPNHYSIVTGLYPAYHGIISNGFTDPKTGNVFNLSSHESSWWLGEPLWETVSNHGLKAASYFWPGSEVKKGSWTCPEKYCPKYNGSVPFEKRVDTVLGYFDLPSSEIPVFMTLYFEDPDHQGHVVGPDDPEITKAVANVDKMLGRLIGGLERRGIFEDVNIILVGDHGMVATCSQKLIILDELVPRKWIEPLQTTLLAITPPPKVSAPSLVKKINRRLKSGKIINGRNLKVCLKEDLPGRLHYSASDRISPIIGLVDEGFKVAETRPNQPECGGAHGYDNALFSMRSVFVGHGPHFSKGKKIPSFENVDIYNLVIKILNIKGAANNGSIPTAVR